MCLQSLTTIIHRESHKQWHMALSYTLWDIVEGCTLLGVDRWFFFIYKRTVITLPSRHPWKAFHPHKNQMAGVVVVAADSNLFFSFIGAALL
jgi:hypothetical protein